MNCLCSTCSLPMNPAPEEQFRLASGGVVNLEAHDLVLKAKYLAEERTKVESLEKAEAFLQQAIKLV